MTCTPGRSPANKHKPLADRAAREELLHLLTACDHRAPHPIPAFFHESSRKKAPKGLASRFQYCQPNECAPAYTQATDAGDVLISTLADGVGWLKVTKFPGVVDVAIANQIDRAIR